jgi:hypothetical protein
MGAAFFEQAHRAVGVAIRHQALAQQRHPHRPAVGLRQFLG